MRFEVDMTFVWELFMFVTGLWVIRTGWAVIGLVCGWGCRKIVAAGASR